MSYRGERERWGGRGGGTYNGRMEDMRDTDRGLLSQWEGRGGSGGGSMSMNSSYGSSTNQMAQLLTQTMGTLTNPETQLTAATKLISSLLQPHQPRQPHHPRQPQLMDIPVSPPRQWDDDDFRRGVYSEMLIRESPYAHTSGGYERVRIDSGFVRGRPSEERRGEAFYPPNKRQRVDNSNVQQRRQNNNMSPRQEQMQGGRVSSSPRFSNLSARQGFRQRLQGRQGGAGIPSGTGNRSAAGNRGSADNRGFFRNRSGTTNQGGASNVRGARYRGDTRFRGAGANRGRSGPGTSKPQTPETKAKSSPVKTAASSTATVDKEKLATNKWNYDGIPTSLLKCIVCKKAVADASEFVAHIKSSSHWGMLQKMKGKHAQDTRKLRLDIRARETQRQFDERRQLKHNSGNRNYQPKNFCAKCDLKFFGTMTEHLRSPIHLTIKNFIKPTCNFCNTQLSSRYAWEIHRLSPKHLLNVAQEKQRGKGTVAVIDLVEDKDAEDSEEDELAEKEEFKNGAISYGYMCRPCRKFFFRKEEVSGPHRETASHKEAYAKFMEDKKRKEAEKVESQEKKDTTVAVKAEEKVQKNVEQKEKDEPEGVSSDPEVPEGTTEQSTDEPKEEKEQEMETGEHDEDQQGDEHEVGEQQGDDDQVKDQDAEDEQVEDQKVEEKQLEEKQVEDEQVEDQKVEEKQVEEKQVEEKQVEEKQVEEKQVEEKQVEEPAEEIEESAPEPVKKPPVAVRGKSVAVRGTRGVARAVRGKRGQ